MSIVDMRRGQQTHASISACKMDIASGDDVQATATQGCALRSLDSQETEVTWSCHLPWAMRPQTTA